MAETETPKPRQRPIVRLGIFLISHSFLFSVVCCTAGVLALLLLPILAKNTYISENALMPGSANPMLSNQEVSEANRFLKDLIAFNSKPLRAGIESQRLIADYMSDLGAEVKYHKFYPQMRQFHPLQFFSSSDPRIIEQNISCSPYGVNIVGIIRAPQGDGNEAIVLVTPYNSMKIKQGEALSLGIAYSVFSLLSRVTWLAKDIIWLVSDSQHGEYAGVAAWLREYHVPMFTKLHEENVETCPESNYFYEVKDNLDTERHMHEGFRRAGTMAAALVIKVGGKSERFDDSLSIYAEASNGQMPNLDLVNIVNYLAVHKQGFRVKVDKLWCLLDSKWLKILGELFESIGHVVKSLNPQWKFGIPASDYTEGVATLASSLYNQALGVPTGPHGAFRDYQVDAITLEISPRTSIDKAIKQIDFLLRGGRLIEGVIRSVNNLLEKFHQSFFLYLLTSPSKFVSVGVYMIAFALLIAPLPMVAASLYADTNSVKSSESPVKQSQLVTVSDETDMALKSWNWVNAAKKVFVVHLWGCCISFLPHFVSQVPNCSTTFRFTIWFLLSVPSYFIMHLILAASLSRAKAVQSLGEWVILKSVTISAAFIGLCLMSVINFSAAEFGGLLIVPMCLMAYPMRIDTRVGSLRALLRLASNLIFVIIGFPPVTFMVLKGAFEGFNSISVGDFWIWVESLWAWSSATYLYIGMVHLPCWALCLHIFLLRC